MSVGIGCASPSMREEIGRLRAGLPAWSKRKSLRTPTADWDGFGEPNRNEFPNRSVDSPCSPDGISKLETGHDEPLLFEFRFPLGRFRGWLGFSCTMESSIQVEDPLVHHGLPRSRPPAAGDRGADRRSRREDRCAAWRSVHRRVRLRPARTAGRRSPHLRSLARRAKTIDSGALRPAGRMAAIGSTTWYRALLGSNTSQSAIWPRAPTWPKSRLGWAKSISGTSAARRSRAPIPPRLRAANWDMVDIDTEGTIVLPGSRVAGIGGNTVVQTTEVIDQGLELDLVLP